MANQRALTLVVSFDEAVANLFRFEELAARDRDLQERASYFRAWYAVRNEAGAWSFGPGKFTGLSPATADDDRGEGGEGRARDSRQAERVLAQWFDEIDPDTVLGQELEQALSAFLARWGRVPNARARISVAGRAEGVRPPRGEGEAELLARIVSDEGIVGGRPRIRGTRMRVVDIVEMLAGGATRAEILSDFPYVSDQDISAALLYAARSIDHRVLRVA